jgi:hypothetical protein
MKGKNFIPNDTYLVKIEAPFQAYEREVFKDHSILETPADAGNTASKPKLLATLLCGSISSSSEH